MGFGRPLVGRLGVGAAIVIALTVVAPARAASGQLDTSFGSGGTSWLSFRACACPSMVRVAPDQKIVVLGPRSITRLTAEGRLDATFGRGGHVALNMTPQALLVDHVGRVVVAGFAAAVFQVRRWTATGTPDAAFDALAESTLPTHPIRGPVIQSYPLAVVEQTVGGVPRYLVAIYNATALRLDESGLLDRTFGSNGFAFGDETALYETQSFALNNRDGSFIFGGTGVAKFTANGQIARGFGRNGIANPPGGAPWVAFGPDGAVYAAQSALPTTISVVRLGRDGHLDRTFGVNGVASSTFPTIRGSSNRRDVPIKVLVQSDGKIVVGAYAFYSVQNDQYRLQNFELARFLPTGALDTTFGTGGLVLGNYGESGDMAFQGSRILIGGDLQTRCASDDGAGTCYLYYEPPPGTRLGMRIARYSG